MRHRSAVVRALAAAVLTLVAVAAVVAGSGGPASAAADVASGWWWRANPGGTAPTPPQAPLLVPLPTAPPPPPAPPNVGAGNLLVAATPDGATSIAAVRATGTGGELTLTVADNGGVGAQAAKLLACKVSGLWTPVEGGRWDDKPSYSCDADNAAPGAPSADGATWTFPVSAITDDGVLDVAIVPAPTDPTTGATAPFQLVFKAPAPEAFGTASKDTATTEFESTFDFEAPSGGFTAPTEDLFSTTDFGEVTTFEPAPTGSFTAPAVRVPARTTPKPAVAPALRQAPAVTAVAVPRNDDAKILAVVIAFLAVVVGYWVSQQQVPALQGLSRVHVRSAHRTEAPAPLEAGLGRFRKVRTGPPPRLF